MLTTKFKMAAKEITFHTHQYIKLSDVYLDITTISKVRDPCRRVRMTEDILRYMSVFHVYRDVQSICQSILVFLTVYYDDIFKH